MAEISPELRRAKEAAEKELLNRPGVNGVDIGRKEVGGKPTDRLAIRVLVAHKRDVDFDERIPETIAGFPTDVIERKFELYTLTVDARMLLQADTGDYPVLKGGISIGPCRLIQGMAVGGTLGAFVTDNVTKKPMLLSNFHVMCVDKSWAVGNTIAQPALIDAGTCPRSVVGMLQRAVVGGQVDCAVAELSGRPADGEIVDIGKISGTNTPALGQTMRKRGRSTMLTYGVVDTVDLSLSIDYGPGIGELQFTNQIVVKPDLARNAKFGDQGDSGAVLVNDAGEVVGLLFGGDDTGYGLANPIAAVLAALNVTMGISIPQPEEPPQPPAPPVLPWLLPYHLSFPPPPPVMRPYPLPWPYPWPPVWPPLPRSSSSGWAFQEHMPPTPMGPAFR